MVDAGMDVDIDTGAVVLVVMDVDTDTGAVVLVVMDVDTDTGAVVLVVMDVDTDTGAVVLVVVKANGKVTLPPGHLCLQYPCAHVYFLLHFEQVR